MYRVTVCYGQPTDPAAFDSHYAQVHVPLVRQVPGLAGFSGGRCASSTGPTPPTTLWPPSTSPPRRTTAPASAHPRWGRPGADVATFATGGVTMFTQQLDDLLASS